MARRVNPEFMRAQRAAADRGDDVAGDSRSLEQTLASARRNGKVDLKGRGLTVLPRIWDLSEVRAWA